MTHPVILLSAMMTLLIGTGPIFAAAGPSYTVAVEEFEDTSGFVWRWDVASTWQTILAAAMRERPRVVILASNGNGAEEAGPRGAQLLLRGAVTHVDAERAPGGGGVAIKGIRLRMGGRDHARVNVVVSVVDAVTDHVLATTDVEGDSKRRSVSIGYSRYTKSGDLDAIRKEGLGRAMEDAAVEAAEWLVRELPSIPWKGIIVAVQGSEIFVNRGRREGVRPGTVFVIGEEQVLLDPVTGEVLKTTFHELARLEAVTVDEKVATCRLLSGLSGDPTTLQPGSEVRLAASSRNQS